MLCKSMVSLLMLLIFILFFLQGVPMCSVAWLHVSLQYCGAEDNHLGLLRWGTSFSPTEGCTPAIHTQKLLKGF